MQVLGVEPRSISAKDFKSFVFTDFTILAFGRRDGNRTHVTLPYLDSALRVYKSRPTANISNSPLFMVRLAGFEPALTPLRYYALEERSGTVAFKKHSTLVSPY